MFQHQLVRFGKFEKHIFQHRSGKAQFSLVPACGACLTALTLNGVQVLDGCITPIETELNNWGKSGMLFPFPNRLKEGRYEWGGEAFEFPINDPQTNTALHGFGMDKNIELIGYEVGENDATAVCLYIYTGDNPSYPFPFTFTAIFKIEFPGQFSMTLAFRNDGDLAIPAGLGWHPYFQLSTAGIADFSLQMPPCQLIGIDGAMIPTGKRYEYDEFASTKKIGTTVLDNCFALNAEEGIAETLLRGEGQQLRFWQETGMGKFNFLQVFTPPHRNSIAIEPMTCNINAFNNGEGLAVLESGEEIRAKFGMEVDSVGSL